MLKHAVLNAAENNNFLLAFTQNTKQFLILQVLSISHMELKLAWNGSSIILSFPIVMYIQV